MFFATSGHSGVDRAMHHLIPAIAARGYTVDLLHVRKHGPHFDKPPPGVNIIDLGTSHVYSSLFKVHRYLRNNRPAVLFSDKDRVNRIAILANMAAGSPSRIIVRSGTTISVDLAHRGAFDRFMQKQSMGKLYRKAAKVIVPCQSVADDLAAYTGLPRTHIAAVPSPIVPQSLLDNTPPPPAHKWFQNKNQPIILSVGALTPRKGFVTLIHAFSRLRQQTPAHLLIIGKGPQRQELQALAEQLGVADDIDFAGFIDKPYAYMAHCDVFAFASRWEGLSFVLVEALGMGAAVVATDSPGGSAEVLQNGRFGKLVPVDDIHAFCVGLQQSLSTEHDRLLTKQAALPFEIGNSTNAYLQAMGLAANPTHNAS